MTEEQYVLMAGKLLWVEAMLKTLNPGIEPGYVAPPPPFHSEGNTAVTRKGADIISFLAEYDAANPKARPDQRATAVQQFLDGK